MADLKTSALPANSTPVGADLIMTVDDVAGTPASSKTTVAELEAVLDPANMTNSQGIATSDLPQFTGIELGHASDTTITRTGAGVAAIEGVEITTNTGTQTLTNKTLTSPAINSPALGADSVDAITEIAAALKSGADGTVVTGTAGTADNVAIWNADGDLVDSSTAEGDILTPSSTDTLTNKTIDANGTGNSISNIDVADLANGTDGELITWDATGAPATVAVGTATQVLTSNGAGGSPTFQDATGGTDPADGWTFNENKIALLDKTLSADGKFSGYGQAVTAGDTIAFGEVCYYAVADSRYEKTDADASATAGPVKIGIATEAGTDGAEMDVMFSGNIREDDWAWTTVGAPVYLSTTAGALTETAPSGSGDIVRQVGYVISADAIHFEPDLNYVEIA